LPEEPALPDNPIPHQQKMWDPCAAADVKNEDIFKQNLCTMLLWNIRTTVK